MLCRKIALPFVAASALFAATGAAFADGGESLRAEARLIAKYTPFVGTQQNAIALVHGLRRDLEVTLQPAVPGCPVVTPPAPPPPQSSPPPGPPGLPGLPPGPPSLPPPPPVPAPVPPASFTPPTGMMGYGNVNIAIELAQQQLVKAGLPNPTPAQIKASFMGGTVSTCAGEKTELQGILVLRAAREGWRRIASELGLSFGEDREDHEDRDDR